MRKLFLFSIAFLMGGVCASEPNLHSIRVMVIDTGISQIDELQPFLSKHNSDSDLIDRHGHGTHITGLILFGPKLSDKVCPEVEIISCKFFNPATHSTAECFELAKTLGVEIVNFSGGGREEIKEETKAVKAYSGIIVVASGNYELDTVGRIKKAAWDISKEPYYPASLNLPNMRVVGNGVNEKQRSPSSNFGLPGMIWREGEHIISFDKRSGKASMSGSSQATAIYTHELLQAACQRLRSAK